MNKILIVPEIATPTRLDKFLHSNLPDFSRSSIQRAIREGEVTVNDKKVVVHHWLRTGDKVELKNINLPPQLKAVPNENVPFKLVAETNDYLVIEKPAGLVVHPAPGVSDPTLIEGLLSKYPEIEKIGDDPLRPGIVHRLDREVSGLMVVAKSQAMFDHLKFQFARRIIAKEYTGLVIGRVPQPSGTIDFPLARSKRQHGKIAARSKADAETREAITHYEVLNYYQPATLLKLKIETGRTHQIRAHLAALGYPLVGDELYRPTKLAFKAHPHRIFLHASSLTFTDLDNAPQTFTSALPTELQEFLNSLS